MTTNKSVEEIVSKVYKEWRYEHPNCGGGGVCQRDRIIDILRQALISHTNTVLRGVVERIKRIEIPKDNSDYELAQLRFRKDVLSLLNDQIISNEK